MTKITALHIYKVSGPKSRFLGVYKDTIILIRQASFTMPI